MAMRGPWVGSALVLVAAHIASALSAQAGRLIGAPMSRRCQGRGLSATIGQGTRTIGRGRAGKRVGVLQRA